MSHRENLIRTVTRLTGARVLVVGDIMLDQFVYGDVNRISPEAPIPILQVKHETNMLGGAGNVVRNIVGLGGGASLAAVVGNDPTGKKVRKLLEQNEVADDGLVTVNERATGIKTRYLAGTQQLLRTDHETVGAVDAKTAKKVISVAKQAMKHCDAVIVSDYGKGVLVPDVIESVIDAARTRGIPVIVDPKGREYWRYQGATIVTPNRAELAEAVGHPVTVQSDIVEAANSLVIEYDLKAVLVTRSQDGMTLVTAEGDVTHLPAEAQEVFDVSGAGDTVVATVAAAMAAGANMVDAAKVANVAAGIVVAKVGTATAYAADVISALQQQQLGGTDVKICNQEQLADRVAVWRHAGYRIGFTNGCFDLLHPGHVSLLQQARNTCDKLIVGLNTDKSVKKLKGDGRPVQSERARSTVLSSLSSVDAVTLFGEQTPIKLIKSIKPDVLIKGSDYSVSEVVGADVVLKYGGEVFLADIEAGHSTTNTIERLGK